MAENIVPLLCRFGGVLFWDSGEVHYKGGKNRIIHVDRAINYPNLLSKVHETCMLPVVDSIKYKYPGLGLDALVSIEDDDDVFYMMHAFPQGSQLIHLFISCSFSTAVVTPRYYIVASSCLIVISLLIATYSVNVHIIDHPGEPDDYRALKASSSDIHGSNNAFMHLPKAATFVSMDLQRAENDIHGMHQTVSDYQESTGEVVDDGVRDNQTANLKVEDNSHKDFREHAMCGSSKFKEKRSGSFHLENQLTPKKKSFKANHNHKRDRANGQRQKHSQYVPKNYHVETDHEIKESYDRTWRSKELVLAMDHFDSLTVNLLAYCKEICRSNPGSVVNLAQSSGGSWRLFLAYDAAIHGFHGACRELLMLKSFHIKGQYPHTWLLAIGLDANNNAFPFACAIVKSNYQENWVWFCVELARILETERKMTFAWDRQEGHLQAINDIFSNSYCRYLREPLIDDFKEKFGHLDKDLEPLFHQATYAYARSEFNARMSKICEISSDAREWIDSLEPKQWARSHLEGEDYCGWDDFEWEFHTWICNAQDLPIVSMMESFHVFMMDLFQKRLQERPKWKTTMTPFVEEYRFKEDFISEQYHVDQHAGRKFKTVSRKDEQYVDLEWRRCSCCAWQVHKIPCTHALAVILRYGLNAFEYCDMCYTVEKYEEAYSKAIHPTTRDIHQL